MITGLDLVEWQLRVAAGEPLPLSQERLAISGHAIEARIYAEDPARDFLPATGRLVHLHFPPEAQGVRIDTGVTGGSVITPWYDPMIAKLIVHGPDRNAALARLRSALAQVEIAGPATNVAFLGRVAASRAFSDAALDTGLIEKHHAELVPPRGPVPERLLAAAAYAELAAEQSEAQHRASASGDPHSPWHHVDGWRLNEDSHHDFVFLEGEARHEVRVRFMERGLSMVLGGAEKLLEGDKLEDGSLLIRLDGSAMNVRAVRDGADWHIFADGEYRRLTLENLEVEQDGENAGSLAAPMPGKIVAVLTNVGTAVAKGEALLVLEAMKMEHTITAPADGVVKAIHYAAGEQVLEGAQLITLEP
jgi:3-methylcrotonyl-CoA carboxylase alpha subunit